MFLGLLISLQLVRRWIVYAKLPVGTNVSIRCIRWPNELASHPGCIKASVPVSLWFLWCRVWNRLQKVGQPTILFFVKKVLVMGPCLVSYLPKQKRFNRHLHQINAETQTPHHWVSYEKHCCSCTFPYTPLSLMPRILVSCCSEKFHSVWAFLKSPRVTFTQAET